ncbi:MAG: hypothetical protein KAI29_11035, partial [Cyclobacteriaceae bacterium]|nr:hypothetical protein [Cyclobacteriaceae bacterium]
NDGGRHKTTQNAIESFIRNVLFGAASTRFHRPTSGQGPNNIAQHVIKSRRSYIDQSDFFNGIPSNHLLLEREENEAFCRAIEGKEYAIFFPKGGGEVKLNTTAENGEISIKWLDILKSEWSETSILPIHNSKTTITAPDQKNWLAYLEIRP